MCQHVKALLASRILPGLPLQPKKPGGRRRRLSVCAERQGCLRKPAALPQPWADRGRGKSESLGPGTNGFIFLERAKSREAGEGRPRWAGRTRHRPRSKQARQRLSRSGPSSVRAEKEQGRPGEVPDLLGHTKPGFMDERRQLGQLRVPLFCRHLRGREQRALSTRPAWPPTLDPAPTSPPRAGSAADPWPCARGGLQARAWARGQAWATEAPLALGATLP